MMIQQEKSRNVRLLSHHDLNGFPNCGEGIALQHLPSGRRVLYIAHESGPKDFTSVDVTDPTRTTIVAQTALPHKDVRSNSLAVVDNTLLVAYQTTHPGLKPAGMGIYDVGNPERPRQIAFFDTSGPQSRGCHCLWWVDGHYAHLSTGAPDFFPTHPNDDQFYMIVDVSDPTKPAEVGRWWLPGTRQGDGVPPPPRHPRFDLGNRLHNANVYPQRPDRAYLGYSDAGVIILDISEMSRPRIASHLDCSPPLNSFTHTVMPLFDRDLLLVTEESIYEHCRDWPKLVWIMDIRDESKIMPIRSLPMPPIEEFCARPGRFGAHNIHENQPLPTSFVSSTLVFGTFFNAGLRVYDITDPIQPKEVASFVPPVPEGAHANGVNDVYVDNNRLIYIVDRLKGGLYILEAEF